MRAGPLRGYPGLSGLSPDVDAFVCGKTFCNCNETSVWPGGLGRGTLRRRKASARISSSSVSGSRLLGSSIYPALSEGFGFCAISSSTRAPNPFSTCGLSRSSILSSDGSLSVSAGSRPGAALAPLYPVSVGEAGDASAADCFCSYAW